MWDVETLFASLAAALASPAHAALRATGGRRYLNALRDIIVPLGRILLCYRSSDFHCVYRGEFTEHNCLRFELGAAGHVTSVDIRFYAPKQRRAMPATARGYTDSISVDAVDGSVAIPFPLLRSLAPRVLHALRAPAALRRPTLLVFVCRPGARGQTMGPLLGAPGQADEGCHAHGRHPGRVLAALRVARWHRPLAWAGHDGRQHIRTNAAVC
jgi:hypothetical protein